MDVYINIYIQKKGAGNSREKKREWNQVGDFYFLGLVVDPKIKNKNTSLMKCSDQYFCNEVATFWVATSYLR